MTDLSTWKYYYNLEGTENVRANLVYTPLVSPDQKTFCMDFTRDTNYHWKVPENVLWTEDELQQRFINELNFQEQASKIMPTLEIKDVDYETRKIFIEWHGDDFLMQRIKDPNILPNWQDQWLDRLTTMWDNNIAKISIHPNSWTVRGTEFVPFNWFFCYPLNGTPITIRSFMIQVSAQRQEKMEAALRKLGFNLDTYYSIKDIQKVALNSFRANYPAELIDRALDVLQKY